MDYAQLTVYSNQNYKFTARDAIEPHAAEAKDPTFARLREGYAAEGMRRTVEAVLLVEVHRHPHVLVLTLGPNPASLPGGQLKPGETLQEGVNRVLTRLLLAANYADQDEPPEWRMAAPLCQQWRPHFERSLYPFLPVHVTKPKEHRQIVVVQLPPRLTFAVPKNYQLNAVPLYDLHDARDEYAGILPQLPLLLSRFTIGFS